MKKPKVLGGLLSMMVETREELLAAREELRGQDRKVEYLERDNTKLREDVAVLRAQGGQDTGALRRRIDELEADVEARRTVYRKVGGLLGCCATGPDILAAIERETERVDDLKCHAELLKDDIDERNARIRQLEEVNEERFQAQVTLKEANAGLKHDLQVVKDEVDRLTSANVARCEQASKAEEQVRELEEELHEKRMHWIPGPNVSAKMKVPDRTLRYDVFLMRNETSGRPIGWQVWDRVKHETWDCWIDNGQRTLDEAEAIARREAKRLNEEDT